MTEFTDYWENHLLDYGLATGSTYYVDLLTASGTDSNDLRAQLTKPTTGGYAPKAVTFPAASGGSKVSEVALTWTNTATGPSWAVVGIAISDGNATGSNVLCYDNGMTDATIGSGEKIQFATGTGIVVSLD